jgi:hypothetical protein
MAVCNNCGQTIMFGGVTQGTDRYCNGRCAAAGAASNAVQIPPEELEKIVRSLHQGNCPKCNGPGPVDVHTSHKVFSVLVMTRWSSHPEVCCRSCGRSKQVGGAVFSAILGWWGIPWGLIMTPVQVCRNVGGLFGGPDPASPSPELYKTIRKAVVARHMATLSAAASAQQAGRS